MQTWTFGPAGIYTATWDGVGKVTITLTAGGAFVASFAAGSLNAALASPVYQEILSPAQSSVTGLALVATTGVNGFTLQNATPNILTWTAPNDGAMHRVLLMFTLHVTSTETGGQVSVTLTTPDGGAATFANGVSAGGGGAGTFTPGTNGYFVQAGTTITIKQNTALTVGAAVLWAELWAL